MYNKANDNIGKYTNVRYNAMSLAHEFVHKQGTFQP